MTAPMSTSRDDSPSDTKQSLLDAAEALIAEHGVRGASLRAITTRASANLASANYHFGSKEALVRAMVARRLRPLNEERLRRLSALEEGTEGSPPLEDLVRAFVEPVVRYGHHLPDRGRQFVQIFGRALTQPDPTLRSMLIDELGEVILRFSGAFGRALPHLDQQDLMWRMHFMVGAMAHTVAGSKILEEVTQGLCHPGDIDGVVERLVSFLSGGLAAGAGEGTTS